MMTRSFDITELLSGASEAANRANLNAKEVSKALNVIRDRAARGPYELWDAIDGEIGKAGAAQSVLVDLRRNFEEQLIAWNIEEVGAAFQQSAETGWRKWTTALAESICVLRLTVTVRVAQPGFSFPEDKKQTAEELKQAAAKFSQRRWPEVYGVVAELAAMEFITNVVRAKLMVILAKIEESSDGAKQQLDAAEKLAPKDGWVLSALGDYWLKQKQFEQAKKYFERAVQESPYIANGYVGLGAYFEKLDNLDDAEKWYKKAITFAAGDAQGYSQLMQLYGRPEMFPNHQEAIADLAERCVAAAPEVGFLTYLDVVDIYRRNGEYETAQQWYEKAEAESLAALRGDKDYPSPKEGLETLANDHRFHNDPEHAIRIYNAIFEIAGEHYRADYHNRLANVKYDQGDYLAASEHYRKAVEVQPSEPIFHRNLAGAYRELEQYEQAEEQLKIALSLDKDEAAYRKRMAAVANAKGNDYYGANEYQKAIEKYTQAAEFDPNDPVIHSNLAGAWERVKEKGRRIESIENAIREYERAHALDPSGGYDLDVQRLQRQRAFADSYGEESLDWTHFVNPIAVEVASDLIPHIEGTPGNLAPELVKYLDAMKSRFLDQFGVRIPGIRFRGNETSIEEGSYIILVMEIPLVLGQIWLNRKFYAGPAAALEALGIPGEPALNPATGDDGFWVSERDWIKAEEKQLELWSAIEFLVRHLEAVLRQNLVELVGHQEVAEMFAEAAAGRTLAAEKLTALTAVCRGLLAEEAPTQPFGAIYKRFDELYSENRARREMVEQIRLLPEVRQKLWDPQRHKSVLGLGPHFEAAIRQCIYDNHSQPILAMEPERFQNALKAVREAVRDRGGVALMVEDAELRPFVRLLIELEFPNIAVFKRAELPAEVAALVASKIEWENEGPQAEQDFRGERRRAGSGGMRGATGKESRTPDMPEGAAADAEVPTITLFVSSRFYSEHARKDSDSAVQAQAKFTTKFFNMCEDLFNELGIIVPHVLLERDSSLSENTFRYRLNEISLPPFEGLKSDEFLVNDTASRLKLINIEAREAINPANGSECAIVQEKTASDVCEHAGLTNWDATDYLVLAFSAAVRRHAALFQTMLVAQFIVDGMRPTFPRLVDTLLSRFSVEQVNGVLQELLDEEISIRDLRGIFESLLSVNGTVDADLSSYIVFYPHVDTPCPVSEPRELKALTVAEYADVVRTSLKRYISHKYSRGANTLPVYLVDRNIEGRLSKIDAEPVSGEENERLLEAVWAETRGVPAGQNPILLTSFDSRRPLRRLLEQKFPGLAVLSYQELSPGMNIQPIARISW